MEDRRLQLLAQISDDHRPTAILILGEVDFRLEEQAAEMRTEVNQRLEIVKDTCEDRFVEVIQILKDGEVERALALKENTLISKAAVDASVANGHAIQLLADSLSGTIAAEQGVKKGGHIIAMFFIAIKWIGAKLWMVGDWLLKAFKGTVIIVVIVGLVTGVASGRLSWHEVTKHFEKIIGE